MDREEAYTLITFSLFAITVISSVWLIRRVNSSNRTYWFVGYVIFAFLFLGIIRGPIAIIASLALLAFMKKDNDNPLADIGSGFQVILALGFFIIFYSVGALLSVGGIYWLWMAIQLKSFSMFLVGILPIFWIVTAPTGAYWFFTDLTPQWVIEWLT